MALGYLAACCSIMLGKEGHCKREVVVFFSPAWVEGLGNEMARRATINDTRTKGK